MPYLWATLILPSSLIFYQRSRRISSQFTWHNVTRDSYVGYGRHCSENSPLPPCTQLLSCFNPLLLSNSLQYCKNIFSSCWIHDTFIAPAGNTTPNCIVTIDWWFAMERKGCDVMKLLYLSLRGNSGLEWWNKSNKMQQLRFYSQWLYSTCFGWQSHPSWGAQCCIWPQVSWLT